MTLQDLLKTFNGKYEVYMVDGEGLLPAVHLDTPQDIKNHLGFKVISTSIVDGKLEIQIRLGKLV